MKLKIILTFFLLIFYILYFIKYKQVLCEPLIQDIYKELKDEVYQALYLLVRQQDFCMVYNSRFYHTIILKKEFLQIFVEHLDWQKFFLENGNANIFQIKNEIINKFFIYIEKEQQKYEKDFLKHVFLIFIEKTPKYLQEYISFIKHFENVDIHIRTIGFEHFIKQKEYNYIQDFVKQGLHFKISFDDNIMMIISWYNIPFIIKIYKQV